MSAVAPRVSPDRAFNMSARTAHLVAAGVVVGGLVLEASDARIRPWRALAAVTGLALLAAEVRHDRDWPRQGSGFASYAHIGVFGLGVVWPRAAKAAAVSAVVFGSVGSHMPGALRHWRPGRPDRRP